MSECKETSGKPLALIEKTHVTHGDLKRNFFTSSHVDLPKARFSYRSKKTGS